MNKILQTNIQPSTKLLKIVCGISVALFLTSLLLIAFVTETEKISGFFVLLFGVLSFDICLMVPWAANVLFILSIFAAFEKKRSAVWLAYSAIICSVLFTKNSLIPKGTSGEYSKILSVELGYYVWVSAIIFWAIGFSIDLIVRKKRVS